MSPISHRAGGVASGCFFKGSEGFGQMIAIIHAESLIEKELGAVIVCADGVMVMTPAGEDGCIFSVFAGADRLRV